MCKDITIISEQKRSIFLSKNRLLHSENDNNINGLRSIPRLILKSKKQAKTFGFSVNIGYPSKNARYSGRQ